MSGGSAGRLQDRRRRGVAGAARTGEVRPAPPGRWRLRRSRLRGADGSSACLRGAGGSDSAAVAAVLAICAANCRGLARPLLRSWGRDGPGAGAGRRAPAGRKDRPDGRGDPPDLRRRREWLADRENRPQDRLGIVGGAGRVGAGAVAGRRSGFNLGRENQAVGLCCHCVDTISGIWGGLVADSGRMAIKEENPCKIAYSPMFARV